MGELETLLLWDDGTEEYKRKLFRKIEAYESIIIFGAGIGGKITLDLLLGKGYRDKVKAFSDNNKNKLNTIYYDFPVIRPEVIKEYGEKPLIVVSSTAYNIILKQLVGMGINEKDVYYFQPAGISVNSDNDVQFIKEHIVEFETVYDLLADNISKNIYSNLLNYRISKNEIWLEKMKDLIDDEADQYFDIDIFKSYKFDEFVDGGGYDGDTLNNFYRHYPQWQGIYYCLEASRKIYIKLSEYVSKMYKGKKVIPMNYAIWHEKGKIYFDTSTYGDGGGSRISDQGEEVECNSLDNLLDGKNIGFIKMDIEGAERNGLIGARKIIQRNNPILAICIYHKPEDFFDIPLLIQMIKPDEYDFYIRQYRYGQSETVLYAMPKSRKIE